MSFKSNEQIKVVLAESNPMILSAMQTTRIARNLERGGAPRPACPFRHNTGAQGAGGGRAQRTLGRRVRRSGGTLQRRTLFGRRARSLDARTDRRSAVR